ncbi:hypothetical protein [Actinomadura rudentiformis]|uniref:Lipoprotein n=1 Tax=Actinomadura rudentiformis TaxID=359158 RepID=A0A6H9Z006_9ACTN|nr:hypothetical protein [Actinomadura rudentiformis]KAB2352460.1 hypothetical protein F8566_01900 [Actinomadura rudentiformis]
MLHRRRRSKVVVTVAAGLAASLVTGCSGDEPRPASARSSTSAGPVGARSGPAPFMSIEQLAATMGCTPSLRGRPADYRQAVCVTATGKYMLNTFDTDKGQQDWLRHSQMYGGAYLVGTRWIVVSTPQLLQPLRNRLGGRLHIADSSSP